MMMNIFKKEGFWNTIGLLNGLGICAAGIFLLRMEASPSFTVGLSEAIFGADFYTEIYGASQTINTNLRVIVQSMADLSAAVFVCTGCLLSAVGSILVVHFLKALCASRKGRILSYQQWLSTQLQENQKQDPAVELQKTQVNILSGIQESLHEQQQILYAMNIKQTTQPKPQLSVPSADTKPQQDISQPKPPAPLTGTTQQQDILPPEPEAENLHFRSVMITSAPAQLPEKTQEKAAPRHASARPAPVKMRRRRKNP